MGRPRTYDEATRQTLISAAESLLATSGAGAVSVRRLADAAGTSTRAVYSVFGSKDRLISALCRDAFRELVRLIDSLPLSGDPAPDLVRIGIDGFRRFALAHPNLFHLVFERVVVGSREPDEAAAAEQAMNRLRQRVECLSDAGLAGGHSVEFVATTFHALCQGLASMELQGRRWDQRPPEAIWTDALTALITGLSSSGGGVEKTRVRPTRAQT